MLVCNKNTYYYKGSSFGVSAQDGILIYPLFSYVTPV